MNTTKQAEESKEESTADVQILGPVILRYKTFEREYIVRDTVLVITTRRLPGGTKKIDNEGSTEKSYGSYDTASMYNSNVVYNIVF